MVKFGLRKLSKYKKELSVGLLAFILFLPATPAQKLLVSDTSDFVDGNFYPEFYFHYLDVETCQDSFFNFSAGSFDSLTPGRYIMDLSFNPIVPELNVLPGDAYTLGPVLNFDADSYNLYHFDFELLTGYLDTIFPESINTLRALNSGYDGKLWVAGQSLYTYHPATEVLEVLGAFPVGMQAAGDLIWVLDKLYMSTPNGLIEVDTLNPMNSTMVLPFPTGMQEVDGLAVLPYRCDSIVVYAMDRNADGTSTVYNLDIPGQSITALCDYPYAIFGATTEIEYVIPPCQLSVDLDEDDSGGISGDDYNINLNCQFSTPIADGDVLVRWPIPLDSVQIQLGGISDIGMEYLTMGNIPGTIDLQDNGMGTFSLINLGNATAEDFALIIENIIYQNDAITPTSGIRTVTITTYAWTYEGATSFSTITIIDEPISLDELTVAPVCFGEANGMVNLNAVNGQIPYSFTWSDGIMTDQRNDLEGGAYEITITDFWGCTGQDTLIIPENDSLFVNIISSIDSICGTNGELTAIPEGGTTPYELAWDNNLGSNLNIANLSPDTYSLLLTDSFGCQATASYTLFQADSVFTTEIINSCENEPIIINAQTYESDTIICLATLSSLGCDSIHCVQLLFQDTFYQEDQFRICTGETLNWQGMSFDQDTSLCVSYANALGCDSTYCLQLEVISRQNQLSASICEGESYLFGGQELNTAGIYYDTISDGGICDSIIMLNLSNHPVSELEIQTTGSLCVDESVSLSVEGQGQYLWSNGANTPTIVVSEEGWYTLSFTDDNSCITTDSILLSGAPPQLIWSSVQPNCPTLPNGIIRIDSSWGGAPSYLFGLEGTPLQTTPLFTDLEAGDYTLIIEDVEGCKREYPITLASQSNLSIELDDDLSIQLGESIELNPVINANMPQIQWYPPSFLNCDTCLNPIATPFITTTYQATLTDASGCTLRDEVTISVQQDLGLFIPNAFSPNEDGRNDRLFIYADASVISIEHFRVFNRWGGLVYERQDFLPNTEDNLHWDGNVNGNPASIGIYVYSLEARLLNGSIVTIKGDVLLSR
jgi:gliding motility-associated-like protein